MHPEIPFSLVLRLRNRAYGRMPDARLRTPGAARRFVKRVGLCLFWPSRGVEAPTLLHAIAGRAIPMGGGYKHPAFGRSWNWKDAALDKRWWYYGRLLRGRATMVSLDLLPAFYALSENYGDPDDYLLEYQDGRLSADAKSVYEALVLSGPMDTVRLRKEARMAGDSAKARFSRALGELQEGLKVLPVGVSEAGAWDYAFVYDLVSRWLPQLDGEARRWSTGDARRRILSQHLTNVVAAREDEVRRFLGWPLAVLRKTAARLIEAGEVETLAVAGGQGSVEMWATRPSARHLRRELSSGRKSRTPASRRASGASARRRR